MQLGDSGMKPDKAQRWAQALAPVLLAGENIHLLVRGSLGGLSDLVAVTDLRVLSADTMNHCAIKRDLYLRDVVEVGETGGLRGPAVTLQMTNGDQRRITVQQFAIRTLI